MRIVVRARCGSCWWFASPAAATQTEIDRQSPARDTAVASTSAPLVLGAILASTGSGKAGHYGLKSGTYSLSSATNYRAGNANTSCCGLGTDDYRRGYVVFDLTGVNGTVTAASVSLANNGGNGGSSVLNVYPVDPANIANLGVGGNFSTLYTDLGDTTGGSGSSAYYTSASMSATTDPVTFSVSSGAMLTDLNTAVGSASHLFAIGLKWDEGGTNGNYIFNDAKANASITLTVNNPLPGRRAASRAIAPAAIARVATVARPPAWARTPPQPARPEPVRVRSRAIRGTRTATRATEMAARSSTPTRAAVARTPRARRVRAATCPPGSAEPAPQGHWTATRTHRTGARRRSTATPVAASRVRRRRARRVRLVRRARVYHVVPARWIAIAARRTAAKRRSTATRVAARRAARLPARRLRRARRVHA